MTCSERIRFKFTSDYPLRYGVNAAAEFDNPDWPRFVRITDVTPNGKLREDTFRSLPPEVAHGYELEEGDILLARSGATVGKTFIYEPSWGEACYAGYLIRSRTSDTYWPKFIYWYFQSAEYWAEIQSNRIQATIQNFSAEKYANIKIPSLSLETQKRVAAFLDEKTARIDGLIEEKRALLERLAEKRQAIITQAVTKGLNSTASMKDSGIDWLGQVPADWVICGLGQKIKLQRGVDLTRDERVEGEFPVISSGGIEYFHDTALCPAPGVLIGRKGSAGKLHYSETPYWPHDTTLYVREFRGNHPRFVWYVLDCLDLASFDTGSSNPTVNRNRVHPMKTPWPPSDEQEAIASSLDLALRKSEQAERSIEQSVKSLSEYRSALITEAVTGQIKVLR